MSVLRQRTLIYRQVTRIGLPAAYSDVPTWLIVAQNLEQISFSRAEFWFRRKAAYWHTIRRYPFPEALMHFA